ncbi:vitamin D3 hydroxylase-associated protein-like isoform X2 [Nycticebus coucang]|uniref:vitamin D3 hydroxylase-associated protein-like isoform X2 n=1 Tax=Nycticebus coucang TaxID=9470 RepID=UPI00234CF916|nr:vitamin D3 hydroxylase-associated protein-like isoform X2 [Nycticebus coucang]
MAWLSYSLVILLLVALLGAVLLGVSLLSWQHPPARNKIPRAQKRREVALQQMEALAQRLRQQEPDMDSESILELPLAKLAQKLRAEELSLESVLCSYLEQALKVHQEVNCLTDFLGECEEQLQALKKLKKSERGLLYGVPISLKDTYDCKGHDSTCGLAQFLEKPAAKDGVIVQLFKAQGAIPFVKTNIPQTLLSYDCSNPIFGQTLNPLNLKKTPGGSSGGEAALLAERGSILGMGTDTGGSTRIPAGFCGVCGFRTTGNRLSYSGIASAVKGKKSVTTTAGPMARDVESLALCLRALLNENMHHLDPTVPPLTFREEVYSSKRPLRIGYYESDGYTQPSPSMARAVQLTSRLLQDAGHQVIPFSIPRVEYAIKHLYMGGLYADGGATLLQKLYVICQALKWDWGGGMEPTRALREDLANSVTLCSKSPTQVPSLGCSHLRVGAGADTLLQRGGHCGPQHKGDGQPAPHARLSQVFLGQDPEVYRSPSYTEF